MHRTHSCVRKNAYNFEDEIQTYTDAIGTVTFYDEKKESPLGVRRVPDGIDSDLTLKRLKSKVYESDISLPKYLVDEKKYVYSLSCTPEMNVPVESNSSKTERWVQWDDVTDLNLKCSKGGYTSIHPHNSFTYVLV